LCQSIADKQSKTNERFAKLQRLGFHDHRPKVGDGKKLRFRLLDCGGSMGNPQSRKELLRWIQSF
jgi:hypothetical protein